MKVAASREIAHLLVLAAGFSGSWLAAQVESPILADEANVPVQQGLLHKAPMVERYGKPYIMVTINGKGPFRFVIDTGTGGDALVTPELAAELELPTVGHMNLSDPSGQGSKKAPVVLIQSIEFAGLQFTNIRAVSHPFFAEAGTCEGLLGFTLFRDYLLTLDFPNRMITLGTGSLSPDGGKSVLPFRMPEGVPIAYLKVDGMPPVEAQLDSGGSGLVLPENLAAHLKYDVEPVVFGSARSVCTRFQMKAAKLASNVKLGRYTFTHPVVEIYPAFPLINFGSPPMQIFAITFDQKNLLVRFASNQTRFSLSAPPGLTRLTNAAVSDPPPPDLVPVG